MKYEKPTYECEQIELNDVVLTSSNGSIESAGEGTIGGVTGEKGIFETLFDRIF